MARYPDCNFIYTSYSHALAKKQTQTVRDIMLLPDYQRLFNVSLKDTSTAKDNFETPEGGSIYAVGAGGTITGRGAGIKAVMRMGGAFIMDDMHKPDEVHSDTIRESVNDWFWSTAQSRRNDATTPFIYIGQRVHEHDLAAMLLATGEWEHVNLPAIDPAGNVLYPEMHSKLALDDMAARSPYVFAAQYQQDPQPAGGGIFKSEWFGVLDNEPEILESFITIDTAETTKDWNDATVFSFWGIYRIHHGSEIPGAPSIPTDLYALHWLACKELRVEPKDLQSEFLHFYRDCMRHAVKPQIVAVERKSTGVTLASVLKTMQGLQIMDLTRTSASGSKTQRFLEIQPYVSTKRITLPFGAPHTDLCITHCSKITANNSHHFDDIADTMYDAVKLALIDEVITRRIDRTSNIAQARTVMHKFNMVQRLRALRDRSSIFGR
jgi:predicted phage terminase large subunit-like protein